MLKKVMDHVANQVAAKKQAERDTTLQRNLMRHEAKIGGKLFGDVPNGHRREFFCLDEHTWVWHEETLDPSGQRRITTTKYDVRPNAVLKSQNGSHYQPITYKELETLYQATQAYRSKVKAEIYGTL